MTIRYPDNDKSEWVREYIYAPYRREGMVTLAAKFYANQRSKDLGDLPFLKNSWKMQIRANTPEGEHQRIQTDDRGRMMHASGEAVLPEDVEDFLLLPSTIRWQNGPGRLLLPWMFPTYDGVLEGLDPQWLRERFSLSIQRQVDENINRYLEGAESRRLSGDHRGTTLDLQVGASNDDSRNTNFGNWGNTSIANYFGGEFSDNDTESQQRYDNVTVAAGSTIDVCFASYYKTTHDGTSITAKVSFEDADDPAVVTSASDFKTRTVVTGVDYDFDPSALTNDTWIDHPSTQTPLQAIIDRGGWASGQAVNYYSRDDGSATDNWSYARSYDASTSLAPKLHIEYTSGENPDARAFFPRVMVY